MEIDGRLPAPVRDSSVLLTAAAAQGLATAVVGLVAWQHLRAATPAYARALGVIAIAEEDLARGISQGLSYDIVVALGLALITGFLALLVRRPTGWVRMATWVTAAAMWFALSCGLAAAPGVVELPNEGEPTELDLRAHDLLVSWYPIVQSVLVFGMLAAVTAAAVQLMRASAQEFYLPRGGGPDQGWGSYLRERDDRGPVSGPADRDAVVGGPAEDVLLLPGQQGGGGPRPEGGPPEREDQLTGPGERVGPFDPGVADREGAGRAEEPPAPGHRPADQQVRDPEGHR